MCAVRAGGQSVCFGFNGATDLGPVVAIAASMLHTCAVRANGELFCLVEKGHGQCNAPAELGPVVVAIAAGSRHTCSVRADSQLVCFGDNAHGQSADL